MAKAIKTSSRRAKPHKVDKNIGPMGAGRTYVKQSDVPGASLLDALRIPQALFDNYAGKPTTPFNIAQALDIDPNGRQLRGLSGASIAFGLIEGGAQAASISATDLARRILRPTSEGEDLGARREAVLRPRVFGAFLRQYDTHPFPRHDIAMNVLEGFGVPRSKTTEVLERIEDSAKAVGFIQQIKGKSYVKLESTGQTEITPPVDLHADQNDYEAGNFESDASTASEASVREKERTVATASSIIDDQRRRKVFITHGKNRAMVDTIKRMLEYGELEPIVSVERESVSKPVPEKVMDDMRGAGAAIIHVDADQAVTDSSGAEHQILNPNVLIEIGAAMAFYGRRFILLVRDGVTLPSNLQGLYQVRYTGDKLDAEPTLKLLEAMKDIKNHSLPVSHLST